MDQGPYSQTYPSSSFCHPFPLTLAGPCSSHASLTFPLLFLLFLPLSSPVTHLPYKTGLQRDQTSDPAAHQEALPGILKGDRNHTDKRYPNKSLHITLRPFTSPKNHELTGTAGHAQSVAAHRGLEPTTFKCFKFSSRPFRSTCKE